MMYSVKATVVRDEHSAVVWNQNVIRPDTSVTNSSMGRTHEDIGEERRRGCNLDPPSNLHTAKYPGYIYYRDTSSSQPG